MKKLRVYIHTSVIGGCFDREFALPSRALFTLAAEDRFGLVVSDVALLELEGAPVPVREFHRSLPQGVLEVVSVSEEAVRLHRAYLDYGVVGPASRDDALHVAVATVSSCDLIVSWNFKHIVHYEKIRAYNAVNLLEGYPSIGIHSPQEVV